MIPAAIQNKQLLSFTYDGYSRTVEPHTYGVDTKGHRALRAYQVGGGSDSGEFIGWKIFHVDEIRSLAALPAQFAGPRQGYKRGDKAFTSIQSQL
jgi:predicted DNA-binding transcriptional regulator YafY